MNYRIDAHSQEKYSNVRHSTGLVAVPFVVGLVVLVLVAAYLTGNLPGAIVGECTLYEGSVQLSEKSQGCVQPDPCGYGRQSTNYCLYYPKKLDGSVKIITSSNCPSGQTIFQYGTATCKALAGQGLLFNGLTCQSDYGYIGSWEIITKQYTTTEQANQDGAFGVKCIKTASCTDGEKANIGCSGTTMTYSVCVNGQWQSSSQQCAIGLGCKPSIGCVQTQTCVPNSQLSFSCSGSTLTKTMCSSDGYSTTTTTQTCNLLTETCKTGYCVKKARCGDGFCDEFQGESEMTCPVDCQGVISGCPAGTYWEPTLRQCRQPDENCVLEQVGDKLFLKCRKPLNCDVPTGMVDSIKCGVLDLMKIVKLLVVVVAVLAGLFILSMFIPFLGPLRAIIRRLIPI